MNEIPASEQLYYGNRNKTNNEGSNKNDARSISRPGATYVKAAKRSTKR